MAVVCTVSTYHHFHEFLLSSLILIRPPAAIEPRQLGAHRSLRPRLRWGMRSERRCEELIERSGGCIIRCREVCAEEAGCQESADDTHRLHYLYLYVGKSRMSGVG